MIFSELYNSGLRLLEENGIDDSRFECDNLFRFACGVNKTELLTHPECKADKQQCERFLSLVKKRCSGYPLQYILGSWEFMGFDFAVGEGVLIPRPETELLVLEAEKLINKNRSTVIFDLCAGSGAIGLSLAARNENTKVYLFEKYKGALSFLEENVKRLSVDNAEAVECDVLREPSSLPEAPDIIISNPPYIKTGELPLLQRVVHFEPQTALDGGDDGLLFYRAILKNWVIRLKRGGTLLLECAEDQSEQLLSLFSSVSSETETIKDFNNIDRIVKITV